MNDIVCWALLERFAPTLSSSWRASLLHIAFNLHSASRIASSDRLYRFTERRVMGSRSGSLQYWRTSSKRSGNTSSPARMKNRRPEWH